MTWERKTNWDELFLGSLEVCRYAIRVDEQRKLLHYIGCANSCHTREGWFLRAGQQRQCKHTQRYYQGASKVLCCAVEADDKNMNVQAERAARTLHGELKKQMDMRSLKLSQCEEGREESSKVIRTSRRMMADMKGFLQTREAWA